jgi:hypothetical protein
MLKPDITDEAHEAAEALKASREAIINRCGKEISDVLQRHQCVLQAEMVISEHGIRTIQKVRYVGDQQQ